MLQQTQVTTVIPYFNRFMTRFPTVAALAHADVDEVLSLWSGLGYYARARYCHKAANLIVHDFNGTIPNNVQTLQTLPGIGQSTAGAICALAFGRFAPILDGNVKRVLTRVFAIAGNVTESAVKNQLWQLANEYTSHKYPAQYTQAIMDLGALTCTRSKPLCTECPLQRHCQAHALGIETQFPNKKRQANKPVKQTTMLIIRNACDKILLYKRPPHGIWGGLWSFPEIADEKDALPWCQQHLQLSVKRIKPMVGFRHTFSHYHLDISPLLLQVAGDKNKITHSDHDWFHLSAEQNLGISAPVRKLLLQLRSLS